MTVVGGFSYLAGQPFAYTSERYEPSETFISTDGSWLYATSLLDAYVNGPHPEQ